MANPIPCLPASSSFTILKFRLSELSYFTELPFCHGAFKFAEFPHSSSPVSYYHYQFIIRQYLSQFRHKPCDTLRITMMFNVLLVSSCQNLLFCGNAWDIQLVITNSQYMSCAYLLLQSKRYCHGQNPTMLEA